MSKHRQDAFWALAYGEMRTKTLFSNVLCKSLKKKVEK